MENNSVNIYLRIRPPTRYEIASPAKTFIDSTSSTDKMLVLEETPYAFDHIFNSGASQEDVFNRIEPSIEQLMKGFNSCVCAYGQSGAGKTYTMGLIRDNPGLITLSLSSLFDKLSKLDETVENKVSVSYIEIYNEKVYDLLEEKSTTEPIYSKGSKYTGATKIEIKDIFDADENLNKGNKNRHVRSTVINATSSRSHAMFSIYLKIRNTNSKTSSVLHLVDLAGSEGVRNTMHEGLAQQEGININQGLLAIGKVVKALNSGKKVVPYRDSVLTMVLQDCLNLDSYFTLIACISPIRKHKSETISTIRFAQSCKALENKMLPEINAYMKQKQRLQARTPLKPFMLPLARNESRTPGKFLSKTPGKLPMTVNRATGTIRKAPPINRYQSFTTPSKRLTAADPSRYSELPHTSDLSYATNQHKESIDNNTFNVMNISSSTEFEGPPMSTPSVNNVTQMTVPSPFMREILSTIDKRLTIFMNTFLSQTTNATSGAGGNNDEIIQNMRNAVMSGINETRDLTCVDDSSFQVPVSSTVVRKPSVPSIKVQSVDDTVIMMPTAAKRTNRRLMTVDFAGNISSRVTAIAVPPRRSQRISMMQEIRQSRENVLPKIKEKTQKSKIKNKIVASYFYDSPSARASNITKKDHKNAIMDLINSGSVKELQLLPGIGQKKAYQIVTYRTVNGKFKILEDVKKALPMAKKSWENFLKSNLLN